MVKYNEARYKEIKVSYLPHLDGGGRGFGQEFVSAVKKKIGKVNHIFEFCAGPGFIGFSLMAHNLCNKLTLADINQEAIDACRHTIKSNYLENSVSVYLSDCLESIPKTEKWDLIVSNPPHWPEDKYLEDITMYDPDFVIHKKFYQNIRKFLKPNGTILMQENGRATRYEDFLPMIEKNGLAIIDVFKAKPPSLFEYIIKGKKPSFYYFIWIKVK